MPFTMRVATFNVRHCEGLDGIVDLERVARVVRATEAEIVALQELDRGMTRSGGVDQPGVLAEATGFHVAFAPTLRRDGGDYGIGIASRDPVDTAFVPLPRAGTEEPRGMLTAEHKGVGIVVTHLTRAVAARPLQLEVVAEAARLRGPRVVVMGDLNVEPGRLGPLGDPPFAHCDGLRTLPARRPRRQIDHIIVGAGLSIEGCRTIATDASDHRPLVADVVVP